MSTALLERPKTDFKKTGPPRTTTKATVKTPETINREALKAEILEEVMFELSRKQFAIHPITGVLVDTKGPFYPFHPVETYDPNTIVVEAINENGDFDFTQVAKQLEDIAELNKVLLGQMSQEELKQKWGLAQSAPANP